MMHAVENVGQLVGIPGVTVVGLVDQAGDVVDDSKYVIAMKRT